MYKELEKWKDLGLRPRVLLHSCCAPCSSTAIFELTPYADVTIFYYNPNIEPYEEYRKRKEEEIRFIQEFPSINKVDILDSDYDHDLFLKMAKGLEQEPERGARCIKCYYLRMEKTASVARENGFDYFATTLTLSPLKDSKKINEIGKRIEEEKGISYLCSDFKKKDGYARSIAFSKEYHLYRQDYCGCIFSKKEREEKRT